MSTRFSSPFRISERNTRPRLDRLAQPDLVAEQVRAREVRHDLTMDLRLVWERLEGLPIDPDRVQHQGFAPGLPGGVEQPLGGDPVAQVARHGHVGPQHRVVVRRPVGPLEGPEVLADGPGERQDQ